MTLADNIHIGDRYPKAPSWIGKDDRATAEPAVVVYIHPEGRYCTVQFANGLTDTVQMVPMERVAAPVSEGYGLQNNRYVRDRLRGLRITQKELGAAFGRTQGWVTRKLSNPMSAKEQQELIEAAERIAAERRSNVHQESGR